MAEARLVAQEAAKTKLATQMGTQIHAGDNYRRVVEVLRSGAIGRVGEIHVWANRACPVATSLPQPAPSVPDWMHWDLWLGPAHERAYSPDYCPFTWRRWWDYSNGAMGDMACHHIDLSFWAFELRYPSSVVTEGPPVDADCCPGGLVSHYEFPARGDRPPIKLTWYDGDSIPTEIHGVPCGGGGSLFVGDKGMMRADYGSYRLLPEAAFAGYTPPAPSIPNSIGHHAEWIAACKTGSPTTCNFDYGGALTEAVLLGVAAYRAGQKIEWDPVALKAKGSASSDVDASCTKSIAPGGRFRRRG